ncbi:MAG TPA: hypothetical protein PKI61_01260 [bacterium]|nr:hypothetical protein [bacterium]HPT29700.1 hypothetical protein [bacterium]
MKNILSTAIASLVTAALVVTFLACNDRPAQKLACQTFDPQCELDKDYQFVKILEQPDSTFVDGFGLPLVKGQWYFRSSKAQTLNRISESIIPTIDLNNADDPTSGMSSIRNLDTGPEDIQSDTVTISCKTSTSYEATERLKVKILLFGSRYIEVSHDGIGPSFAIRKSKQ